MKQKFYANGKRLEAELRAYHAELSKIDGAPRIGRLHAAARLGKADGDFSGVTADGRTVLVEAKEVTARARFELKMIDPHQMEALRSVGMRGGVAVLVVRVGDATWAMGWEALQGAMAQWAVGWATGTAAPGTASLSPADLDRVGARLEGVRWWGVALPGWSERQGRLL